MKLTGRAILLVTLILMSLAPNVRDAQANPSCDGCAAGEPNVGYGDGSDGDYVVPPGANFVLPQNMNYRDFTVSQNATVNTRGRVLRVCGRLVNNGTITDTHNGGPGGSGGAGGYGSDPNLTSPAGCADGPLFCRDGDPGQPGEEGLIDGAGRGGNGGSGDGGGGSARRNAAADANGGDGADGGAGGKGGGVVRIYAYCLENYGLTHADGSDGQHGGDAPDDYDDCGAEYFVYAESCRVSGVLSGAISGRGNHRGPGRGMGQ